MSVMVTTGKLSPKGLPVEGSMDAGPVEPIQLPSDRLSGIMKGFLDSDNDV